MEIVLSRKNMNKCENLALQNGFSLEKTIRDSAKGVYDSFAFKSRVAIVCGVSNNAAIGYALASILKDNKIGVTLFLLEEKFSKIGKALFDECVEKKIPYHLIEKGTNFGSYSCIVDAIYGINFNGDLKDLDLKVVNKINASKKKVISIDIPSGLNADNGICSNAVHSYLTVALSSYKIGHFLHDAKDYIDHLTCAPLGYPILDDSIKLFEEKDVKKLLGKRSNNSDKGDFGYVSIMGGSVEYSGSVKLASMGLSALLSGCGVSRICVPEPIAIGLIPYVLESTIFPMPSKDGKIRFDKEYMLSALDKTKALLVGIGWGSSPEYSKIVKWLIRNYNKPIIFDADGINTLAKMDLNELKNSQNQIIITPHIKEFSRISKIREKDIINDPIKKVKDFAKKYNMIVLLKGPTTVISDGESVLLVNKGVPGMATAGSGDVLAGILAGLLGYNKPDIKTVAAAAYINGYAGEIAQGKSNSFSMIARNTVKCIPDAITKITK